MSNYKLVCNEQQLQIISSACELYARLMMGQFNAIMFNVLAHLDIPSERYREIDDLLDDAGKKVWDRHGGHPGIHSQMMPDAARVAWDLHAVVRQLLAFQGNPEGGIGVNFDNPRQSSQEPLPEVRPTGDAPDPRPCKERLRDELAELLNVPPDDFETAIQRLKKWKACYEQHGDD